jgi:hypothetical protein
MFPDLVFRASEHSLFEQLRLFIFLDRINNGTDRLELSLKSYYVRELLLGRQQ